MLRPVSTCSNRHPANRCVLLCTVIFLSLIAFPGPPAFSPWTWSTALAAGEESISPDVRWSVETVAATPPDARSGAPGPLAAKPDARGSRVEERTTGPASVVNASGTSDLKSLRRLIYKDLKPEFNILGGVTEMEIDGPMTDVPDVALTIESNLSTGYIWHVASGSGAIRRGPHEFEKYRAGIGAPERQILHLVRSGTASPIKLVYKRSWVDSAPTRKIKLTFSSLPATLDLSNPEVPADVSPGPADEAHNNAFPVPTGVLPSNFDWRTLVTLPPARDQGNCGSCWAFGTVAAMEASLIINGLAGADVDLSEQFLIDCNDPTKNPYSGSKYSCEHGGYPAHMYHYDTLGLSQTTIGAVLESDVPYVAYDQACSTNDLNKPYSLDQWGYTAGSWYATPTDDQIKNAIYTYGPVGAGVCSAAAWFDYKGGIYTADDSAHCNWGVNHMINLVGWNDDEGYWILRNTWGSKWGMNGYMYMKYGISRIGQGTSWVVTPGQLVLALVRSGTGTGVVASNPAGISCGSTCSASFLRGTSVTLTGTPATGSDFSGWTGCDSVSSSGPASTCTVAITSARSVSAAFTLKSFTVEASVPGGHGSVSPGTRTVNYGGSASLLITPDAGYHISSITDNGVSKPVTNPYVITNVASSHTVVVAFSLRYTLSVRKGSNGSGTITSSPDGINCGSICTADYILGSVVTLTATPDASSRFAGWSGAGCSNAETCKVTMNGTTSAAVFFPLKQFAVAASVSGGGTALPSTLNVDYGSTATITITPNAGYHIASITDNGVSRPITNPYVITNVTAPHTVAATFGSLYVLGTARYGTGSGTITSTPAGINCGTGACATNFTQGSVVTLTATPDGNSTFTGWSGGGCSGTGICTVTMNSATRVPATFTIKQFAVTASASGGSSTVDPSAQNVNYGSTAMITIIPDANYVIRSIVDNGGSKPVANPYRISDVTTPHTVAVNLAAGYFLTLSKSGTGSGFVISSPAGIYCGTTCSAGFTLRTAVTLTATPAANSTFTGWSGSGCSGTGICTATMNSPAKITAAFTLSRSADTAQAREEDGTAFFFNDTRRESAGMPLTTPTADTARPASPPAGQRESPEPVSHQEAR